jgi:hypothetical protein
MYSWSEGMKWIGAVAAALCILAFIATLVLRQQGEQVSVAAAESLYAQLQHSGSHSVTTNIDPRAKTSLVEAERHWGKVLHFSVSVEAVAAFGNPVEIMVVTTRKAGVIRESLSIHAKYLTAYEAHRLAKPEDMVR